MSKNNNRKCNLLEEKIKDKELGIYKIISECDEKSNDGHKLYLVECVKCGWRGKMQMRHINEPKKCSHVRIDGGYKSYYSWNNRRLKNIFTGMKRRCYNKENKDYSLYGGKGICVCDEWLNNPGLFENWAIKNNYNDTLTIDRISSNKDYSPENCRWVSLSDNAKYKSTAQIIEVDGEKHTGREWSLVLGFGINTINRYIREYGLENTKQFIHTFRLNPNKEIKHRQSYYDVYMNYLS